MLVFYYNLNNEVFAIYSEGNNVKCPPLKCFKCKYFRKRMAMLSHYVFDQFRYILNHFRHQHQHLTHLLSKLDILHRASRAYMSNYYYIYHNFTQFCTFLASKFAVRFARNSSIYCLYIS